MLPFIRPESQEEKGRRLATGMAVFLLIAFLMVVALVLLAPRKAQAQAKSPWSAVIKVEGVDGQPVSLRIFDAPCTNAAVMKSLIQAQIRPEFLPQFRAARLHWHGKEWESCWLEFNGMVYSMDEEGSALQPLPRKAFREDSI